MGKKKSGKKSDKNKSKKSAKSKRVDFSRVKPKSKCCRKSTRCVRCPVVIHRMNKVDGDDLSDKQFRKAIKKARAA